jgi:hypothetical protein
MKTSDRIAVMEGVSKNAPDFELAHWNENWIMSGEAIRCRHCLAPQWPSNADDPVRHCPGCELSKDHFPLHELVEILSYRGVSP